MGVYEPSNIDPLSEAIALLKPRAVAWRVIEAQEPWTLRLPTTDLVIFGQVMTGACVVRRANGSVADFDTGDFLIMAAPRSWTMGGRVPAEPVDFDSLLADPGILMSAGSTATVTRVIAGAFMFEAPNGDLLADLLPSIVHIRGADVVADRLGALLKLLGDEAMASRPGRSLVLDRILEIILVESLRYRPADSIGERLGLLAGLEHPRIGAALRLLHREAQRPWTVATLARAVGMSRSAFAASFKATVGGSPIEYLLRWRMNLAKAALATAGTPMTEIAELAGYQSVSAFSTAFSRANGVPPSAFARNRAQH